MMKRIGVVIASVVAGLAIAVATAWGAGVLVYLGPGSDGVRKSLAWIFVALGLAALGALSIRRARQWAIINFLVAFALVLVVWESPTGRVIATVRRRVLRLLTRRGFAPDVEAVRDPLVEESPVLAGITGASGAWSDRARILKISRSDAGGCSHGAGNLSHGERGSAGLRGICLKVRRSVH